MIKKKNNTRVLAFLSCFLLFLAITIFFIVLFSGKKTIINGLADVNDTESLACEGTIDYPFLIDNNGLKKKLTINATFNNNKLDSIALIYKVFSKKIDEIERITLDNNLAMVKSFSENGITADLLGTNFSNLRDASQMSLYATKKVVNQITAKYFLLDKLGWEYDRDKMSKVYNEIGLNCVANN